MIWLDVGCMSSFDRYKSIGISSKLQKLHPHAGQTALEAFMIVRQGIVPRKRYYSKNTACKWLPALIIKAWATFSKLPKGILEHVAVQRTLIVVISNTS